MSLNLALFFRQIPEWGKLAEGLSDASQAQNGEQGFASGYNREEDVMLNIDPSHIALQVDQHSEASRAPPEKPGFFGQQCTRTFYCAFIVAVAILLVNWF